MGTRAKTFRFAEPTRNGPKKHKGRYGRRWARFRTAYAQTHPAICQGVLPDGTRCGLAGRSDEMDLDHVRPIEAGGEQYDETNVQWLCKRCHSRKTVTEDGGFGRARTSPIAATAKLAAGRGG